LAAHWNDKARDLLVRDPEADLGGFPFVTEALLAVGLPDRALDSAAAAKLTYRNDPILAEHAALLEAQAYLDLEKPVDAAEALQSISGTSAVTDAALQLRVEALRQAGVPALAKVVAQTAKGR